MLHFSYASGRLARLHLRLSEFHFDVVLRAGVTHQAADAMSRFCTDCVETTNLDDNLSVCNVENTLAPGEEINYVHACTECDNGNEPNTGRPAEDSIKKWRDEC